MFVRNPPPSSSKASATLRASLLVLASLLAACSSAPTFSPVLEPPPGLPEGVLACLEDPSHDLLFCEAQLADAIFRQDAVAVGQLLWAATPRQTPQQQPHWARLAVWFDGKPWLPRDRAPDYAFVTDMTLPQPAPLGRDAILAIGATKLDLTPLRSALKGDVPVLPVTLDLNATLDLPISTAALVAASGNLALTFQGADGQWYVQPAAPLIERLAGIPVAPTAGAWDFAVAVAKGDRHWRQGEVFAAWQQLNQALLLLPNDPSLCHTRAPILFALTVLDQLIGGDQQANLAQQLDAACTHPDDANLTAYFTQVLTLTRNGNGLSDPSTRPRHWSTAAKRRAYAADNDALAQRLDARPAVLLNTLTARFSSFSDHLESWPVDRTFDILDSPEFLSALFDFDQKLARLGRPDLHLWSQANRLVTPQGDPDRVAIRQWMTWSQQEENRWLHLRPTTVALGTLRYAPWLQADPRAIDPLCLHLGQGLEHDMANDHMEAYLSRNATRIFTAIDYTKICRNPERIPILIDLAMERARHDPDPSLASVQMLGELLLQGWSASFNQSDTDTERLIAELAGGLQRLRARLSDTPDDQVVRAGIDVVTGLVAWIVAGVPLETTLGQALDLLTPVANADADPEAPLLVRLAPGLRLALVIAQSLQSSPDGDTTNGAAFATLQRQANLDLPKLLKNFRWEEHEASFTRCLDLLAELRSFDPSQTPDWHSVQSTIHQKLQPSENESGAPAIVLDLTRLVIADYLAYTLIAAREAEHAELSLREADRILDRLRRSALEQWDLEHSLWDLTALVLPLQRAVLQSAALDIDITARLQQEAPSFNAAIQQIAQSLSVAPAAQEEIPVHHFILRFARAMADVGVEAWFDDNQDLETTSDTAQSQQVQVRFVNALEAAFDDAPENLSLFADLAAALLLARRDPPRAQQFVAAAERAIANSEMSHLTYVPRLLFVGVLADDAQRQPFALAVAESLITDFARPQLDQQRGHILYSLLPYMAKAYLQRGDAAMVREAIELYRALVAFELLSGNTQLQCQLNAQRGPLNLVLKIQYDLDHFHSAGPPSGNFQLGLGLGTHSTNDERIDCQSPTTNITRYDKQLYAFLSNATVAMRLGDQRLAELTLLDAIERMRLLVFASTAILGPKAIGLATSQQNLESDLAYWVLADAYDHGHVWTANQLLLFLQSLPTPTGIDLDNPPRILDGMATANQKAILTFLLDTRDANEQQLASAHQRLEASLAKDHQWKAGIVLSARLQANQQHLAARDTLRKIRLPVLDPVVRTRIQSWITFLEHSQERRSAPELTEIIRELAQNNDAISALIFVHYLLHIAFADQDTAAAMALTSAIADHIDADLGPLAYADFITLILPLLMQLHDHQQLFASMSWSLAIREGRIPLVDEMTLRQTMLSLLAQKRELAALADEVDRVLRVWLTLAPEHPNAAVLNATRLSLQIIRGQTTAAEEITQRLEALAALAQQNPQADLLVGPFVQEILQVIQVPDQVDAAARAFVGAALVDPAFSL